MEDEEEHIEKELLIKKSKQKKKCIICGEYYLYSKVRDVEKHRSSQKYREAMLNTKGNVEIMEYETAFKSRLRSYRINNYNNIKIPLEFLEEKRKVIIKKNKSKFWKNIME